MNLKEKISKLFVEESNVEESNPRSSEFDAILEDHPVGNQNIYRLHYVDFHRIGGGYSRDNVGCINFRYNTFMLPEGISREEGFKVLSYLTDLIEKKGNIGPWKSVETLNNAIKLEKFGFKIVTEDDESKILDLFTVSGRLLLFKKSELYQKYFEWYVENIFDKDNMEKEFENVVYLNNRNDGEYSRKLKPQNK